jgi:2-oxoglutarate dehydrogenase E2 component (dihydrolipoamide succinyltransferase)
VPNRAARSDATTTTAAPATSRPLAEGEEREEMSKLRQTIARRLVEAQHATASLTTFNEVDLSAVMALRDRYKDQFEKLHGIGLGFMSFFAKAVMYAFKHVPQVNWSLDGTTLIKRKGVHLGIAVSTDRGLMVPVIRDAQHLSMAAIES